MENVFDEQGAESESIIYQYLSILQKRKGVILAFSGVLIITAIISTMLSTRYYSSKAVIEIMPIAPSIMGKDAGEAVTELGVGSDSRLRVYYGTQFAILASNTILGKAVKKLQFEHGFDDFDNKEDPIAFLRRFLSLKPKPETTLINIKIEYPDSEKAAIMANVIANVYMEHNLDNNLQSVRDALTGIEKEHERFREAKHRSDEKVHSFKFENHMIGIDEQSTYIQNKMKVLQQELTDIQVERVQVQAEYHLRKRIFNSKDWLSLAKSFSKKDVILQQYLSARVTLLDNKNKLSVRYRPKHPEMVTIAKQLESSSKSIRDEVFQEISSLQTELSVLEAKEEILQQELEKIQIQVKELDQRMIELAFITSEAEKNRKLYTVLDERMSQVDLAQFMQSNNVRFVDQAVSNNIPVSPSLSLNLMMAIVLGGIGGVGLAFLIEFLDNTVKSKEDLESMIGMPLLGVVPVIPEEEMLFIVYPCEASFFCCREFAFDSYECFVQNGSQEIEDSVGYKCSSTRREIIFFLQSCCGTGNVGISCSAHRC
jgi:succinoglycan biosynthesis transport protein ExoP